MKNAIKGFIIMLLLLFGSFCVNAETEFINNNNINISAKEYNNLINLGFTENEILNMKKEEFDNNKDLTGKIVSKKTEIISDKNELKSLRSYYPGYVETGAKKMTTTIISVNNRYRYKVTVEWKSMPIVRSYDIIGIGIEPIVRISSGLYFQSNYCYSANNCSSNGVNTQKITSTGATSTFKLPTSSIVSMDSYLYFEVEKNTAATITELNAAGDYAHATSSISLNNAQNHSINIAGIQLNNSISSYYDSIPVAMATLTCNW